MFDAVNEARRHHLEGRALLEDRSSFHFRTSGDPLNSIGTKDLDMASGDCGSTPRRVIAAFRADADSLSVDEPLAPQSFAGPTRAGGGAQVRNVRNSFDVTGDNRLSP
jgi:hypothetical protein